MAPCGAIAAQGYPSVEETGHPTPTTPIRGQVTEAGELAYILPGGDTEHLAAASIARACAGASLLETAPSLFGQGTPSCRAEDQIAIAANRFAWALYETRSWQVDDPSGGCAQHAHLGYGCDPVQGAMTTRSETSAALIIGRVEGRSLVAEHTVLLGSLPPPHRHPGMPELPVVHPLVSVSLDAETRITAVYAASGVSCSFSVP